MKITKTQLKQIIKEELGAMMDEDLMKGFLYFVLDNFQPEEDDDDTGAWHFNQAITWYNKVKNRRNLDHMEEHYRDTVMTPALEKYGPLELQAALQSSIDAEGL